MHVEINDISYYIQRVYFPNQYAGFQRGRKQKNEILQTMENICNDSQCGLFILMVTDIVAKGSEIIAVGKAKELLSQAFEMKYD